MISFPVKVLVTGRLSGLLAEKSPSQLLVDCLGGGVSSARWPMLPQVSAAAPNSFLELSEPRKFIAPGNFANVGFAFPAALGAKLGRPDCPVVAFVGDGGWGFALQEVMTALEEKLPVVVVLFNNGVLGAEKANQLTFLGGRFVGVDVAATFNYAEIAKAMGAKGVRLERIEEVGAAFSDAINSGRTCVLEIMTDPNILNKPFRGEALSKAVRYLDKYRQLSA